MYIIKHYLNIMIKFVYNLIYIFCNLMNKNRH
jgi:hypothetical protein